MSAGPMNRMSASGFAFWMAWICLVMSFLVQSTLLLLVPGTRLPPYSMMMSRAFMAL